MTTIEIIRQNLLKAIEANQEQFKAIDGAKLPYLKAHLEDVGTGLSRALFILDDTEKLQAVNIRKDTTWGEYWGEYIVPSPDRDPSHAYRTSDKEDAILTARHLHPGRIIKLNGKEV